MAPNRSQRTEKPTGKRLEKARKEGNVARTKELPAALSLAGFLIFFQLLGGDWTGRLKAMMADSLSTLARPDLGDAGAVVLLGSIAMTSAMLVLPPLGVLVAAGIGGHLLQGPPAFTAKPLTPDLTKLSPMKGLAKIFKLKALVELSKTSLKLVLFTVIAAGAVREAFEQGLIGAPGAEGTYAAIMALGGKVVFRIALLAAALALLDYLFTKYDHAQQLMMSKQEVRDERREQEGDPLVKARVRSKQMSLARSRMMADVAKATVVITNPTHFAVALRYQPGEMDVPQVMAKGRARLAEKIREIAKTNAIPIVSDPPLARALYHSVQIGSFIPQPLFRAVAEVLALVLRGKPQARRPPVGDS